MNAGETEQKSRGKAHPSETKAHNLHLVDAVLGEGRHVGKWRRGFTSWNLLSSCDDVQDLEPHFPWAIEPAKNGQNTKPWGERFDTLFEDVSKDIYDPLHHSFPLARWSLERTDDTGHRFTPFQIDYSKPLFMSLADQNAGNWPASWVVVPEEYEDTDWIYLAFAGLGDEGVVANHPMHLHGHDFEIRAKVLGL